MHFNLNPATPKYQYDAPETAFKRHLSADKVHLSALKSTSIPPNLLFVNNLCRNRMYSHPPTPHSPSENVTSQPSFTINFATQVN